jgi:hypothetical protein
MPSSVLSRPSKIDDGHPGSSGSYQLACLATFQPLPQFDDPVAQILLGNFIGLRALDDVKEFPRDQFIRMDGIRVQRRAVLFVRRALVMQEFSAKFVQRFWSGFGLRGFLGQWLKRGTSDLRSFRPILPVRF